MRVPKPPMLVTRRMYLTCQVLAPPRPEGGVYPPIVGLLMAVEAVASTALEHPEWDMDEERTWEEWGSG